MDFSLTDDHLALQDAVRRFCDGEYPAHQRGNAESAEQAAQRWQGMAELGLLGLLLGADVGGSAQSAVESMLVAQELGRALGGGAWVSSVVVAGQLLDAVGSDAQRQRWLPALACGELRATLALYEPGSRYDWQRQNTAALRHADGWRLHGRKSLVLDAAGARLLIVAAQVEGAGPTLFTVEADAPGVQVQPFKTLDGRHAATVVLQDVVLGADAVLGEPGGALPWIEATLDRVNAVLCAEAVGALDALIDLSAEQLKTRKQFGSVLAKFQVLQHRMADMLIALEQCKSMACAAAMGVEAGDPAQRVRLVSAAKVVAGQAARQLGEWAIQLHGAMGMTDECRVGHYAKRLLVISQLFGNVAYHQRRFAQAA